MPELRETTASGGHWIRPVDYSPSEMSGQRNIRRLSSEHNKENIPPGGRRRSPKLPYRRRGRTPLPVWYPRSPLRDITSIVKALQRRRLRLRLQAVQAAEASPSPSAPVEAAVPNPLESSPFEASCFSSSSTTTISTLQAEQPDKTPEPETALLKSTEHIEKAVRRNMKEKKTLERKAKRAAQVRTLKSMR
ncbi:hypothetical protein AXF42_Ash017250 [Apostasia shenzhenica]|uniref:Protein POLYCHOME n=1 Tax=Apostasia shenzhenica TaxID=1088818 RepID=A0A2H9ZVH5_9ASPA|nr:hypothetical protein AXF42_Ash017250 [Apostasia shenzhenica]